MGKHSKKLPELLKYLYGQPLITASGVAEELKVSNPTARSLITTLLNSGILSEITGYARNRQFAYTEYLALFSEGISYNNP